MTGIASWLAVLYVALLPVGRADLPLNAQWGDFVLPVLAVAAARERSWRRWCRLDDWPLGLYLLATLVTAMISADPAVGVRHLVKQLSVALVFLVFRQLADDPVLTRALAATFVLSVAALTLTSISVVLLRVPPGIPLDWLGASDVLPFLGMVRRLRGGLMTPEMLGNGLVVALVFSLALRAIGGSRSRALWTAVAAILVAGEFLTFSHSVAGFAVAGVFFTTATIASKATRVLAWSAASAVVVTVNAASLVEPGPRVNDYGVGPVSLQVMGTKVEGELNHYAALKQVAWSAFLDSPLAGAGPGRFPMETERAFAEGWLNERYRNKVAQCDLMGRLAETGIFGGLSLLLLWASWLREGLSIPRQTVFSSAAFAAVVGLLVNSVNADVMNFRFLWLALAWMRRPDEAGSAAAERF